MEEQKRKTKTSSTVKNRYNKKVYSPIGVMLPKELVAQFKEKCKEVGVSQAQIVKKAIEDFLRSEDKKTIKTIKFIQMVDPTGLPDWINPYRFQKEYNTKNYSEEELRKIAESWEKDDGDGTTYQIVEGYDFFEEE